MVNHGPSFTHRASKFWSRKFPSATFPKQTCSSELVQLRAVGACAALHTLCAITGQSNSMLIASVTVLFSASEKTNGATAITKKR